MAISDRTTGVVLYVVGAVQLVSGGVGVVSALMAPGRGEPTVQDPYRPDDPRMTPLAKTMAVGWAGLAIVMGAIVIHGGVRLRS